MKLKNINPLGDVEVFGIIVPFGEIFAPTTEQATQIILQRPNWEPADDEAEALLNDLENPSDPETGRATPVGDDVSPPADIDASASTSDASGSPDTATAPAPKRSKGGNA